ncbi:MAG: 16S rRNA (uracil(1498)-N(3))-methyltransferase [Chloroflexi bacterium]|nr:MAG: 16S rRNA (uracil(1498)-N(3))-methyltransferase [Chloroflexota bacterium]
MHRFFVAHDILAPISAALSLQVTTRDAGSEKAIEDAPEGHLCVALPEKIAHQVRDVLHLGVGEQVVLLDNSGDEFLAAVVKNGRAGVEVQVRERRKGKSESPVRIVLCQGLLKSARFEWILEKGTELGVAVFAPMLCRRSMAGLEEAGTAKIQRWQRIIQEAAEQCGRARVPELLPIRPLMHALNDMPRGALAFMPWEEEHGRSLREGLEAGASSMDGRENPLEPVTVMLFIGPEGGLMNEEVLLARRHGVQVVTLGPRILRAETAALVTVASVMYALGG